MKMVEEEILPKLSDLSDEIQTITGRMFRSTVLEGRGPIAVEFMSYGCQHCAALEPVLQLVAQMVKNKERIFRVNIGVEPELVELQGIQSTPTFIMFLNGVEVGRAEGPLPTISSVLTALTHPFKI